VGVSLDTRVSTWHRGGLLQGVPTGIARFGHCVMPAGQVCQPLHKDANSRTIPWNTVEANFGPTYYPISLAEKTG
jgi:hypothetical protein